LILPGVGAFPEAMNNLRQRKLVEPLRRAVLDEGKPLLGICLGMQLLADSSEEYGVCRGLSLIPGQVRKIPLSDGLRLPHIGWNGVSIRKREPLFLDINEGGAFYFVHSYRFECDQAYIAGITDYGVDITAAVQKNRIFGVQFHPERSQRKGLHLLRNFVDFVESTVESEAKREGTC
jgi:glutamine amidotransferase